MKMNNYFLSLLFFSSCACGLPFRDEVRDDGTYSFDYERYPYYDQMPSENYKIAPLSSLKEIHEMPRLRFDLSNLSPRASPHDLRNFLEQQIVGPTGPNPKPTPPQAQPTAETIQKEVNSLRNLIDLRGLKSLKTDTPSPTPPPAPQNQNENVQKLLGQLSIASALSQLIEASNKIQKTKEKAPQICIQFIDFSPKAIESLSKFENKNQTQETWTKPAEMSAVQSQKTMETSTKPPASDPGTLQTADKATPSPKYPGNYPPVAGSSSYSGRPIVPLPLPPPTDAEDGFN